MKVYITKEEGKQIRLLRRASGLNDIDASILLNISRTTIGKIERGEREVRLERLEGMERLYNAQIVGTITKNSPRISNLKKRLGNKKVALAKVVEQPIVGNQNQNCINDIRGGDKGNKVQHFIKLKSTKTNELNKYIPEKWYYDCYDI